MKISVFTTSTFLLTFMALSSTANQNRLRTPKHAQVADQAREQAPSRQLSAVITEFSPPTTYKTKEVNNATIFYREAGNPDDHTIFLFHGFPSSSHQYRDLIPLLSDKYHLIAPDYPGFGSTIAPDDFTYTFDNIGSLIADFVDTFELPTFSIYIFDYGAPVGFRVALQNPEKVYSIIAQNGIAHFEGFNLDLWQPIMNYWANNTEENRDALRPFLTFETTTWQYTAGAMEERLDRIGMDSILHDQAILDRDNEIQLDLFRDYRTNVEQYPEWQAYLNASQPKILAVWAADDPFFPPPGAEAFRQNVDDIEIEYFQAGHFALETHAPEIANAIRRFLSTNMPSSDSMMGAGNDFLVEQSLEEVGRMGADDEP